MRFLDLFWNRIDGPECFFVMLMGFVLMSAASNWVSSFGRTFTVVACVIKHDDVRSLRRYCTTSVHESKFKYIAVYCGTMQRVVFLLFEIAGENATPKALGTSDTHQQMWPILEAAE